MSTASDPRDVVDVLTEDHHDVLELIATIRSATDPARRRDTADTVIAEIVRHSIAEEQHVYPVMRDQIPGGDDEVEHDIKEHQELEETMKALERLDGDDPDFGSLVDKLHEQLRHHVEDEERDQFPKLREHISRDDLVELGRKVVTTKEIAPTRPHPHSPHSELFHKALGPGVGLVDKVRDRLTGRVQNT